VTGEWYVIRHTQVVNDVNHQKLNVMTSLKLKGSWNELKGKLKQKYGQLTDDDLTFAEGKEDEMLGRLQKRLGKNKEELRKEIEAL
jgi:uncharacterized protein YjbJ (UPF0337 family)